MLIYVTFPRALELPMKRRLHLVRSPSLSKKFYLVGVRHHIKLAFLFLICMVVNSFATYVAVLETISGKDLLGISERMYLTDKLREIASRTLPAYMDYTIMTRENINAMLPPGKSIEDCEGSCLAETGKNIAADYVAQGRIGVFGQQLTLTVELYETASNKLVASFTARRPDAEALIEEIENKAPALFENIKGNFVVPVEEPSNFGTIIIDPEYPGSYGSMDQLKITVNGKTQTETSFKLQPGNYTIGLSHRCYEYKESSVTVTKGKKMSFRKPLSVAMGGITIITEESSWNEVPVPVYADGEKIGETPLVTQVPVCAEIQVGRNRETISLNLQEGEMARYTYVPQKKASVYNSNGNAYGARNVAQEEPRMAPTKQPENASGSESKMMFEFSFGPSFYDIFGDEHTEFDVRFGFGFEYDFVGSRHVLFGLGLGIFFENKPLSFGSTDYYYSDYYYDYGYYGSAEYYDGNIYLLNLTVPATLALGWTGFKFFVRAAAVINLYSDYEDAGELETNSTSGLFELGFRFARNHELFMGYQGATFKDAGSFSDDGSFHLGYRYLPTIGKRVY